MTGRRDMQKKEMVDATPLLMHKNAHMLNAEELGKLLEVSGGSIYKWIGQGEMPKYIHERLKELQKPKSIRIE